MNWATKDSPFCRHHRKGAKPAWLTGTATWDACSLWRGSRQGSQPVTGLEAQRLTWYRKLLANLKAMAEEHGRRLPLLEGEFTDQDPPFLLGEEPLPLAALVIFRLEDEISVTVGVDVYSQVQVSVTLDTDGLDSRQAAKEGGPVRVVAERVTPGAVPIGEDQGRPFMGFSVLMGQFIVLAHEDVPRTSDGLPDLRAMWVPRDRWGELVTAVVPSPSAPPVALPGVVRFPADRIHKGAVEAFSAVSQWRERDGWHSAYSPSATGRDEFSMMCGFRDDPGEAIWQFLLGRGEATIKAHYALWARLYEQTRGEPGQLATMNVNQFCADLGFAPHKNGGYKLERKQEAVRLMEALTSVEVAVRFKSPGRPGKVRQLRGRLWTRGLVGEEQDDYGDLFGQVREGDPRLWDPVGFTYGPGPWFADKEWRRNSQHLGLMGAGLLKLRTDTDAVAIRIGGYFGYLARANQFKPTVVIVETLVNRIGMAESYPRHPGRLQALIEKSLDKLGEVEVLSGWRYMVGPEDERPWRDRRVEVTWPEALTANTERLEEAQQKRVEAAQRKALGPGRGGSITPPPPTVTADPTHGNRRPHPRSPQIVAKSVANYP